MPKSALGTRSRDPGTARSVLLRSNFRVHDTSQVPRARDAA